MLPCHVLRIDRLDQCFDVYLKDLVLLWPVGNLLGTHKESVCSIVISIVSFLVFRSNPYWSWEAMIMIVHRVYSSLAAGGVPVRMSLWGAGGWGGHQKHPQLGGGLQVEDQLDSENYRQMINRLRTGVLQVEDLIDSGGPQVENRLNSDGLQVEDHRKRAN